MPKGSYRTKWCPGDPDVGPHSYMGEARWIARKALGKSLPKGAIVHHIDGNPANNRNDNLLVCNRSYHLLLHQRHLRFNWPPLDPVTGEVKFD